MKKIDKMVPTTIYVADDGTEFSDAWDCVTYENNCFYESIHALGKDGKKVFHYYELIFFSIDSINQITKLKNYARENEIPKSELERVTEKGIYVWNGKAFCKYPEDF